MSRDDQVIKHVTPADLLELMRETGLFSVQEQGTAEGRPVVHAAVKVVNAQTGATLPGGLPFSVVLFKGAREPGYSNIAIGTVVPAAELGITLPDGFFNLCNQRFRFIRAFPVDANAFVLQMDLFLSNATREYVKFNFGLWSAMFSHVLFELLATSSQPVEKAVEVFASAENVAPQFAETAASEPPAEAEAPVEETVTSEPTPAEPVEPPPEAAAEVAETATAEETGEPQATAEAEAPAPAQPEAAAAETATEPAQEEQKTEEPADTKEAVPA